MIPLLGGFADHNVGSFQWKAPAARGGGCGGCFRSVGRGERPGLLSCDFFLSLHFPGEGKCQRSAGEFGPPGSGKRRGALKPSMSSIALMMVRMRYRTLRPPFTRINDS
jgi:hypothetical protein